MLLRGLNVPITSSVQMTFYRENDYFMFIREVVAARLSERSLYPKQVLPKLVTYVVRSNNHGIRFFNFQQGLVGVNTATRRKS